MRIFETVMGVLIVILILVAGTVIVDGEITFKSKFIDKDLTILKSLSKSKETHHLRIEKKSIEPKITLSQSELREYLSKYYNHWFYLEMRKYDGRSHNYTPQLKVFADSLFNIMKGDLK